MNQKPTLTAIYAAELRIAEAKENARNSLQRARVGVRANVVRPATLMLITGLAGVAGFLIARGAKQSLPATETKSPTLAGVVLAFIVRYGIRALPFVVQKCREALSHRRDAFTAQPQAVHASRI